MLAHTHKVVHHVSRMADADLATFRGHNAAASMAVSDVLAKPSVIYADVVKLLTDLGQRGAMPVHQALQVASTLPSDPKRLRHVVVCLQEFLGHMGSAMRAEHQRRGVR